MRLLPLVFNSIPLPIKPLITKPCTVLLPAATVKPFTPAPALMPLSSIIGVPAYPGWVVPSIMTDWVMVGKAEEGAIVWAPPFPILKRIVSWGLTVTGLTLMLAKLMALRRLPMLLSSWVLVTT